jgi:hypothetical protein
MAMAGASPSALDSGSNAEGELPDDGEPDPSLSSRYFSPI